MAHYSQSELNMMQQDAIRRAKEMRQMPKNTTAKPEQKPAASRKPASGLQSPFDSLRISELLGSMDSEKITILAVLILLAREGADLKLLAALGYIML